MPSIVERAGAGPTWGEPGGILSKIIVVDDQRVILKMVRMTLESAGHDVICLQEPAKLLLMLPQERPDALILDILMPEVSGWDLLTEIRQDSAYQSLPIIMLTALNDGPFRVRGLRAGANEYMGKPFDPAELIARLDSLLTRQREDDAKLIGDLQFVDLPGLVQYLAQHKKSGRLEVHSNVSHGHMDLASGDVADASFGAMRGAAALEAMLELRHGSFRFVPMNVKAIAAEGEASINHTLFQAAWVEDELKRKESFLPGTESGLTIHGEAPCPPEEGPALPLETVFGRIKDRPGITLDQLLAANDLVPNRVRLTVAYLAEHEAVKPRESP